jgi:hypothetical protein
VGLYPEAIVTGDFNGDGKLDILTVNANDGSISVLLGKGDGTFTTRNYSPGVSFGPIVAVAGDFNHDGRLDLVVGNSHGWNANLLFFQGQGDGTFAAPVSFDEGSPSLNGITAADLDHDGNLDIVTAGYDGWYENSVSVLRGNGDGTFQNAARFQVSPEPNTFPIAVAVGDLDGDGNLDVATLNSPGTVGPTYTIFLGNGDGTLRSARLYSSPIWSSYLALTDFNGDGNLDLVAAVAEDSVSVLLGNGDGTFGAVVNCFDSTNGSLPTWIATGDFNGDGKPDVAVCGVSVVRILLNQTISAPPSVQIGSAGGKVRLSWPVFGNTSFVLECATNLLSPNAWMPVTNQPVAIGGQFVLTNEPAAPCFYRLRQP